MKLSDDKRHVTYEVETIQELLHYLNSLHTNAAKDFIRRLSIDKSRIPAISEEERRLRLLTEAERRAMLYGASLPKDCETLQILRKLSRDTNSDNC